MVRPSVFTSYNDALEEVTDDFEAVVVSHLLNQISDLENKWKGGQIDDEKMSQIVKLIQKMCNVINDAVAKNESTKFIVVMPFIRTNPVWLFNILSDIKDIYKKFLNKKIIQVETHFDENDLNKDGIHLKKHSLGILRNLIKDALKTDMDLDFSLESNDSPVLTPVNDKSQRKRTRQEADIDDNDIGPEVTDRQIQLELLKSIKRLESKFDNESSSLNKEQKLQSVRIDNNLIAIARVKEEMDGIQNYMKRNQIIIRNLVIPQSFVMPKERKDQAEAIRLRILTEISKLKAVNKKDLSITGMYILPVGGSNTTFNDLRVTCGSADEALEVKHRVLGNRYNGNGFWGGCEINSDQVKATRIRVSLMSAIARELRLKGLEANMNKHVDNPTLCLRNNGRISKQLTFVDAVLQHGSLLSSEDLAKARRVAGGSFIGQLEQYFLILKETGMSQTIPVPSGVFHTQEFDLRRTNGGRGRGGGSFVTTGRGRGRGRGSNFTPMGRRKMSTLDLEQELNVGVNNGNGNHQQQIPVLQGQVLYSQAVQMPQPNIVHNEQQSLSQPTYVGLPFNRP